MTSSAQIKANNKYNKEKTILKSIRFTKETESDLLEWLEDKPFSTYVKRLIREDIEKHLPNEKTGK